MKRMLIAAAMLTLAASSAPPALMRVDVDGVKAKIGFREVRVDAGCTLSPAKWLKPAEREAYISVNSPELTRQWREFGFSFTPQGSGEVRLMLRGNWTKKPSVRWVDYDRLEVSGAYLANPGFEKLDRGVPAGWILREANLRNDRPDAAEGRNYVRAAHNFPVIQLLKVRSGVPVRLKFRVRAAEFQAEQPAVTPQLYRKVGLHSRYIYDQPREYFRFYNDKVKYLPRKNKGLTPDMLVCQPDPVPGAYPEAQFVVPPVGEAPATAKTAFPVELLEEDGIARAAAIRFGFPVAEKTLFDLRNLAVLDPAGKSVPAQFAVLGRWPDGSLKWILTQFTAPLQAHEKAVYTVTFGREVRPVPAASPLKFTETAEEFVVVNGDLRARISKTRFTVLEEVAFQGRRAGSLAPEGVILRPEEGRPLVTGALKPEKIAVLENGPQRLVFKLEGKYGADSPGTCTVRIGFTAGSPAIDLAISHTNTDLKNEFTDLTALELQLRTRPGNRRLTMPGSGTADAYTAAPGETVFQAEEQRLAVAGRMVKGAAALTGAGTVDSAAGPVTFALRDAAFRYPKSFAVTADTVQIGLLPEQPDARFGTKLPYYLQFPFCEGKYRLKWGMSFTEELKIDFSGRTAAAVLNARDIVPVIDRDYLHDTRAVAGVLPKADQRFADWDAAAVRAFHGHMLMKMQQREYGFLNYGDSFGERGRNWTNNEYDLAHGLFQLFLRTGDRDVFRWARLAARHQADVDIIHASPDPYYLGANAQHGIGHTGINHQRIYPGTWSWPLDYSFAGTNGHTWSDGMLDAWCLAGDSRVMDAALMLGEHLTRYTAPRFEKLGTHERTAGWSVKAILGFHRVTGDPKFLHAAARIVGIALKEQKFDRGGAWPHKLPRDHAGGHPNTFGNVPFLIGTLLSGLREYHLITGDPAVERSIVAGGRWQMGNYDPAAMGFPYTASWDNRPYWPSSPSLNMLVMPGIIYSGVLSGDRKAYAIACDVAAMETVTGLSPVGKNIALHLVYAGDAIDDIIRFERRHPGAKPYAFDAQATLHRLRKKAPAFNVRGPERKELEITLTAPETALVITRDRTGARPEFKPECRFVLTAPDGGTAAERTLKTTDRHYEEKFAVTGRPGDLFRLTIDDDLTGCWNVVPAPGHHTRVKLEPESSFSGAAPAVFYFTVPAGTREFAFQVQGVHLGAFQAWAFRPDGTLAGKVAGLNVGGVQLPWLKTDRSTSRTLRVKPDPVPTRDETWKLLILTVNDIRLGVAGLPPYLSIVPAPQEEKQ